MKTNLERLAFSYNVALINLVIITLGILLASPVLHITGSLLLLLTIGVRISISQNKRVLNGVCFAVVFVALISYTYIKFFLA